MIGREGKIKMNIKDGTLLFVDTYHFPRARIFYSVNRFFYIIYQPSLFFKKRGPAFLSLLPPPPFPHRLPVPSTESYDPLSMSGSPPREPADDAHGQGTAVDPASNTGQCPIQYPGLLPRPSSSSPLSCSPLALSPRPPIESFSCHHRNSREAW